MIQDILQFGWDKLTLQIPMYLKVWIVLIYIHCVLSGIIDSNKNKKPLIRRILYSVIEGVIATIILIGLVALIVSFIDLLLPGRIQIHKVEGSLLLNVIIITIALIMELITRVLVKNKGLIVISVVSLIGIIFSVTSLWIFTLIFNSIISMSFSVILIISVVLTLFVSISDYNKR